MEKNKLKKKEFGELEVLSDESEVSIGRSRKTLGNTF